MPRRRRHERPPPARATEPPRQRASFRALIVLDWRRVQLFIGQGGRELLQRNIAEAVARAPARRMIAKYDYNARELSPNVDAEVELSFRAGDLINTYGEMDEDGFYIGELNGQRGLVPSNFLEPYTGQQPINTLLHPASAQTTIAQGAQLPSTTQATSLPMQPMQPGQPTAAQQQSSMQPMQAAMPGQMAMGGMQDQTQMQQQMAGGMQPMGMGAQAQMPGGTLGMQPQMGMQPMQPGTQAMSGMQQPMMPLGTMMGAPQLPQQPSGMAALTSAVHGAMSQQGVFSLSALV